MTRTKTMVLRVRLALTSTSLLACAALSAAQTRPFIHPFPLNAVRLNPESHFAWAAELNRQYIMGLNVDSLLYTFRQNAGFATPGEIFAGSWEDPGCEVRGQFMGHYLSATATLLSQTDDPELTKRMQFILAELKQVQDKLGGGYLSAFPTEHFDRLRNLQPVWAPFYVIHKIMAGLLDHHLFTRSAIALDIVTGMADYFVKYVDRTINDSGTQHWHDMLNNEFGGMAEVLYNLYDVTQDKDHVRLARLFTKPAFYEPLVALEDPLSGLHANTHLAQVNGFAAQYEKTGDKDALTAVQHFFDIVTRHHSYATGGNNVHEFWGPPSLVADAIKNQGDATETEETCTQYNMLKIARYLFRWTGNVTYADYYERAITNGLLGTQRMPADNPTPDWPPASTQANATSKEKGLLSMPASAMGSEAQSGRTLERPAAWMSTVSQEDCNCSLNRQLQSQEGEETSALDAYSSNWRQAAFAQFRGLSNSESPENAPGPGVLLYLLPLGAGQGKGDSTHGWGTPLHSFWCCYGSSVESFAKLVDSIYFYRMNRTSKGQPAAASPELYINQMVSSSLDWRDVGLRIKQTASFSGPRNTAFTKLEFESNSSGASPQVVVKLRIPGWVKEGAAEVRLNGQPWKECHQLSPTGAEGLHGTALSAGSYCSLKGAFKTGDVITAKLPMIVRAETIQDSRVEFKTLKAAMVGPLLMAGLTNGSRQITALHAADLAAHVADVSTEGLLSMKLLHPWDPPTPHTEYLQHNEERIAPTVVTESNAARMAATFRRVHIHTNPSALHGSANGAWLETIAYESMDRPGQYMCGGKKGDLKAQLHLEQWRYKGEPLQPECHWRERSPPWSNSSNDDCWRVSAADEGGLYSTLMQTSAIRDFGDKNAMFLQRVHPLGQYPDDSKMWLGQGEQYVLSPLGNIVDEQYTAYFEFVVPTSG